MPQMVQPTQGVNVFTMDEAKVYELYYMEDATTPAKEYQTSIGVSPLDRWVFVFRKAIANKFWKKLNATIVRR
jgi:hypothetical protein